MGLQARIAADAANRFLGADTGRLGSFRQTITHNAPGVAAASVSAIVDLDNEDASQGELITNTEGTRLKRHGLLELSSDVDVVVSEKPGKCSTFTIGGDTWVAVRIVGRDQLAGGLQTVAIRIDAKVATKQPLAMR